MVKVNFSLLTAGFIVSTLLGLTTSSGSAQELHPNILKQLKAFAREKASRTHAQKKMSSRLVYEVKARRGDPQMKELSSIRSSVRVAADETVLVDIKARVNRDLLVEIEQAGGDIINAYEEYGSIRAKLPLYVMEKLAENNDIQSIRPAVKAVLRKVNTSEGDAAHSGPAARNKYNLTGKGVKVGVISDSVDHLAAVQASGDLPSVTVLEDAPGNSGEGTAMLEIVHDLAPDAQLYFATAWNGPSGFANNIKALANVGCQVIVDDVGYLNESPFQDDIISQAVNTVTADGVLYFAAAGNSGNFNDGTSGVWEGNYSAMGSVLSDPEYTSVHNYGGGDWANRITSPTSSCYTLFWTDPLARSSNDYDFFLVNPAQTDIVDGSADYQDGTADPIEGFCPDFDSTGYHLLVARYGTGLPRFLHISANRGQLEHRTAGQIVGHPAATDAFGVSAVSARNRTIPFIGNESVETFTTDGPRRVFFNPDGSAITPGNYLASGGMVRRKPDISAADGVKTATPGFTPFYGTSAAAPHAAAIGALMLSGRSSLTVDEARQTFIDTAYDIEAPGWDRDSGYGLIMADKVLDALAPFGINPGILYPLLMR